MLGAVIFAQNWKKLIRKREKMLDDYVVLVVKY